MIGGEGIRIQIWGCSSAPNQNRMLLPFLLVPGTVPQPSTGEYCQSSGAAFRSLRSLGVSWAAQLCIISTFTGFTEPGHGHLMMVSPALACGCTLPQWHGVGLTPAYLELEPVSSPASPVWPICSACTPTLAGLLFRPHWFAMAAGNQESLKCSHL